MISEISFYLKSYDFKQKQKFYAHFRNDQTDLKFVEFSDQTIF